jgi:hypothetical protein
MEKAKEKGSEVQGILVATTLVVTTQSREHSMCRQ